MPPDPQRFFRVPLVHLADDDPFLHGIYTPASEIGIQRIGVTAQFLEHADRYHEAYSNVPYFRFLLERALSRLSVPVSVRTILDLGSGSGKSVLPGSVLAGSDCLLVPSLVRESYSLATREALAAGVPVIESDSGGPGEIVADGANGLLFATGDAYDLALRMRRVVLEPALRARLRAGAAITAVPTVAGQAIPGLRCDNRGYANIIRLREGSAPRSWRRRDELRI